MYCDPGQRTIQEGGCSSSVNFSGACDFVTTTWIANPLPFRLPVWRSRVPALSGKRFAIATTRTFATPYVTARSESRPSNQILTNLLSATEGVQTYRRTCLGVSLCFFYYS
jgi:hypothetical protein